MIFLTNLLTWRTIGFLWTIFVLYWLVSALRVKQAQRTESPEARFATVGVLGVAAILIFARGLNLGVLSRRFVSPNQSLEAVAVAMVAAGIALAIWARRHIGEFWSARMTLKEDHQLIQSGPYARVRHPIYSGLLLAMLGTALFIGEWRALLGVALVFVAHWQKARREEALLAGQFGSPMRNTAGARDRWCRVGGDEKEKRQDRPPAVDEPYLVDPTSY
jgi:protein-S-isoprenylcysteine O-methyltransferase Ste14